MRITRWGNALAVQIPAEVVARLDLKEGDEVDLLVPGREAQGAPDAERRKMMDYVRSQRWQVPAGWRFDREEANER